MEGPTGSSSVSNLQNLEMAWVQAEEVESKKMLRFWTKNPKERSNIRNWDVQSESCYRETDQF